MIDSSRTVPRFRRRLHAGTLALALAVACSPPFAIWVLPGSTAKHLRFGLATQPDGTKLEPLGRIEVVSCEEIAEDLSARRSRTMWLALGWGSPREPRTVGLVSYGEPPPGLRDSIAAQPLAPGCYDASASAEEGSGHTSFIVMSDGSVRAPSTAEWDSMGTISYRRQAAMNVDADSAIAKCKRGYSEASAPPDSARVDRAVWTDSARFGSYSCEWFRDYYWSRFGGRR